MRRTLGATLFAVLALAMVPAAGRAQNTWQQVVNQQIATFATTLRGQGYNPVSQIMTGSLNDDADQGMPLALNAGMEYVIVGACDQDCSDFDLRIFGPNGQMLAEDVELDDRPLLRFVAPTTGNYRLVNMMANCSANPCYFGVQVFGK